MNSQCFYVWEGLIICVGEGMEHLCVGKYVCEGRDGTFVCGEVCVWGKGRAFVCGEVFVWVKGFPGKIPE